MTQQYRNQPGKLFQDWAGICSSAVGSWNQKLWGTTVGSTVQRPLNKHPDTYYEFQLQVCSNRYNPLESRGLQEVILPWEALANIVASAPPPNALALRALSQPVRPLPSTLVKNMSCWNFSHSLLKNCFRSRAFPYLSGVVPNCPPENTT